MGVPILVIESGRAGLDHFKAGDFRPPVYEFFVNALFHFPDFLNPVRKYDVLFRSAHEGHCGMCMHVDESRHGSPTLAVHDFNA